MHQYDRVSSWYLPWTAENPANNFLHLVLRMNGSLEPGLPPRPSKALR